MSSATMMLLPEWHAFWRRMPAEQRHRLASAAGVRVSRDGVFVGLGDSPFSRLAVFLLLLDDAAARQAAVLRSLNPLAGWDGA